ncbi:MAG: hypothetical protein R3272_01225 [Candidatus Promineifilaceae bacterium]|nr:hypothetical protein [Candidatus Promineifilaceae bacterium]
MNSVRKSLEERARDAILQYAFLRPESAFVIAATLTLTALSIFAAVDAVQLPALLQSIGGALPWYLWLGLGALVEGGLVYSSLTDPEAHRRVVAAMLRDEFQPERLQNNWLQEQVRDAFDYRSRITAAIRERRDTVLKDHLEDTAAQLDEWLEEVYLLALRLDRYQQERDLHRRNREQAHKRLSELESRLSQEQDPAVRQEIEQNVQSLQRQLQAVAQLENAMERARLRLENTLTAMGTIYTQTMLVGAKDIDSGRASRLRQEIGEEVSELADVLSAMDEVYAANQQR